MANNQAAAAIIEVAATGSDGNAGSDNNCGVFDPTTNTANYVADLTTNANTGNTATPVVTSATISFAAGDASNWLFTIGGASWTLPTITYAGVSTTPTGLWAKISSVAGGAATLDAAVGHVVYWAAGGPFAVNTTAGVSTQATPTSGKGCVDYSQTGTAIVSAADLASTNGTSGTPTVTSASRTFDKRDIGNHLYISAGTNWTVGIYRITNTSAGGAILNAACGSAASLSSGTYVEGGCLASPGQAGGFQSGGNHIYIKKATYSIASNTQNVATGKLYLNTAATSGYSTAAIGYGSFRSDSPTGTNRPTLKATITLGFILAIGGGNGTRASYLIIDGNSQTSTLGLEAVGGQDLIFWITIKNCPNGGFVAAGGNPGLAFCDCTNCATTAFGFNETYVFCAAWSNTTTGFSSGSQSFCLSVNNSGGSSNGFTPGTTSVLVNCTAYGNGQHGFGKSGSTGQLPVLVNCISYGNTSEGFGLTSADDGMTLINCAAGGNSTNFDTNIDLECLIGCITLTANPFNNTGNGDFGLNSTAGGGAACQAAGAIGAFPGVNSTNFTTGTTTYVDLGAVQHQGGAAGMIYLPDMVGGCIG